MIFFIMLFFPNRKNMQKYAKSQQLKGGRFLIPVDRGQRAQTSPYSSL